MLDTIGVPIVMKAVDFLFGVAKSVLDERRAAREKSPAQVQAPPEIPLLDQPKETVVHRKISQDLVKRKEQAIQSTLEEIDIYQSNYQALKKRVALYGGPDYAPIADKNQLRAQEDALLEASQKLAAIVQSLSSQ